MSMPLAASGAAAGFGAGALATCASRAAFRRYGLTQPPTVEIAGTLALCTIISALVASLGDRHTLVDGVLCATLSCVAWTDVRNGHVFDVVTAPLCGLLCAAAAMTGQLPNAALGAAITMAPFFLIRFLYGPHALGLGDVKLAACIGAAEGWRLGLQAIWFACCLGGVVGIALVAIRRSRLRGELPFAPFLLAGTLSALVCTRWGGGS